MIRRITQRYRLTKILFFLNFLYTLHFALVVSINSSFLDTVIGNVSIIGILYTLAAIIGVIVLANMEKALVRFGNYATTVTLLLLDSIALSVLALAGLYDSLATPLVVVTAFITHYATAVFVLKFNLDLYLEENSETKKIGLVRGEYLTMSNIAWVLAPFVAGALVGVDGYWKVYTISIAVALLLLAVVGARLSHLAEPRYKKIYFFRTARLLMRTPDLRNVFLANILLYVYFSWMIIYLPIYAHDTLGISWLLIGSVILPVMLLPYVLIDIPAGYIADRFFGERELLIAGFMITVIFTALFAYVETTSFIVIAAILFGTRIGTALIEVMTDTYFFKRIQKGNSALSSLYRNGQPIAYVIAPVTASMFLFLFPGDFRLLFGTLTVLMCAGIIVSYKLSDR